MRQLAVLVSACKVQDETLGLYILQNTVRPSMAKILADIDFVIPPALYPEFLLVRTAVDMMKELQELALHFMASVYDRGPADALKNRATRQRVATDLSRLEDSIRQSKLMPATFPPMQSAFKPLGERLAFWQRTIPAYVNQRLAQWNTDFPVNRIPLEHALSAHGGWEPELDTYLEMVESHTAIGKVFRPPVPTSSTERDRVLPKHTVEYCNVIFEMGKRAYYYGREPELSGSLRDLLQIQLAAMRQDLDQANVYRDEEYNTVLRLSKYETEFSVSDETLDFFESIPTFVTDLIPIPDQPGTSLSPADLFHVAEDSNWAKNEHVFRLDQWYILLRRALYVCLEADVYKADLTLLLEREQQRQVYYQRHRQLSDIRWNWLVDLALHIIVSLESVYDQTDTPIRLERPLLNGLTIRPRGYTIDGQAYYLSSPTTLTAQDQRLIEALRKYRTILMGIAEVSGQEWNVMQLQPDLTSIKRETFTYQPATWTPERVQNAIRVQQLLDEIRNDGTLLGTNPLTKLSPWQSFGLASRR